MVNEGSMKNVPIIAFPDAISDGGMIPAASFLYFDQPVMLMSPPAYRLGATAAQSMEFVQLVARRKPAWGDHLQRAFSLARYQNLHYLDLMDMLEPLRGTAFDLSVLSYPADTHALQRSAALLESTQLPTEQFSGHLNEVSAAAELVRHLVLEMYIQHGRDLERLYEYADELFSRESCESLLAKAYLFRCGCCAGRSGCC